MKGVRESDGCGLFLVLLLSMKTVRRYRLNAKMLCLACLFFCLRLFCGGHLRLVKEEGQLLIRSRAGDREQDNDMFFLPGVPETAGKVSGGLLGCGHK